MNIVVFDLEWNQACGGSRAVVGGTVLSGDIIQIGAVKLDEALNEVEDFKRTVAPGFYKTLNPKVYEVTRISQEQLDNGIDFPSAVREFLAWCGEDCLLCSWGGSDIAILSENLKVYGLGDLSLPPCLDLQKLFALQVLKEPRRCCALLEALELLNEEAYNAHDALNDAANTVTVLWHLDLERDRAQCLVAPPVGSDCLCRGTVPGDYPSFRSALSALAVKCFRLPLSGELVSCREFIPFRWDRAYSVTADRSGVQYLVELRVKRTKQNKYRVSRTVSLFTENALEQLVGPADPLGLPA